MVEIIVENVTKRFGAFTAIDAMSTSFEDSSVTCLLGPSGCGKTTLMRMIVGLEKPTVGRILFGGRDVTKLPPRKRNVGMVFQYPVMYPTLSVEENIDLPMRQDRSVSAAERGRRVDEVLDVLDMRDQRCAFIDQLDSGGRQKVAVGRAIARQSDVVLFDEPTTNVEVFAKLQLIRAFKLVTQRLRQTIVYVTHDQTEAMTLADQIALMNAGQIVQYDPPDQLYAAPRTEFAGWFLGNPGMNFLKTKVDGRVLRSALGELPAVASDAELPPDSLRIGVRPENLYLNSMGGPGAVVGVLRERTLGIAGVYVAVVQIGVDRVKIKTKSAPAAAVGEAVYVTANEESMSLFSDGTLVRKIART